MRRVAYLLGIISQDAAPCAGAASPGQDCSLFAIPIFHFTEQKEFGIEVARIILGHHSAAITEVYAEKDEQ